ncbi:hypothetical protein [Agrobacterium sp. FDAARGOS_525]|uniref:hypothetical protein n=1 Tax=Agrobacterium sp. FDAARGOS_525 TaxID=2420311 RepID=UPI00256F37DF|nr:hypothetical protein [Agrobacterium sp. FDAARGOS_525]
MLRVDLARCNAGHHVVLGGCDKLLLHNVDHIHRCHDVGDIAMNLQRCRLVAGRLADHDHLDEITYDRH